MCAKKLESVELKIDRLNHEGYGVGSVEVQDGSKRVVEVPYTIPGERVRVQIVKRHRRVWKGTLEAILSPSPHRIEPRCVHFEDCGGCKWQQMPYAVQIEQKEAFLRFTMNPFIKEGAELRPAIPCDPPWEYRNKMEFSFSSDRSGNAFLGLIRQGSQGRVVDLTECHLVSDWFMETIRAVKTWWKETELPAYHPIKNSGTLRRLTLREGQRTGDRMVILTVSGLPEYAMKKEQITAFTEAMRRAVEPQKGELSLFIRVQQAQRGQPTQYYEMHLYGPDHIKEELRVQVDTKEAARPYLFRVSPTAFFQPNTRQADRLYSAALQLARLTPETTVYDLCCGIGSIGICAAPYVKEVVGVEFVYEAILDARTNAAENDCGNITFHHGDVGEVVKSLIDEGWPKPQCVIVDPPRAGLGEKAVKEVLALEPEEILYVSCAPRTQAADMAQMREGGYRCKVIQPVDQFPQTVHLENIALLRREG